MRLQFYDFDSSFNGIKEDDQILPPQSPTQLSLVADRFDPASPDQQAALKLSTGQNYDKNQRTYLGIISTDNAAKLHWILNQIPPGHVSCSAGGLAVGNFDRKGDPDPNNPNKTQPSFKRQLAITTVSQCNPNGNLLVKIFNVDPPSGASPDFSIVDLNSPFSKELSGSQYSGNYNLPVLASELV